MEDRCGVMALVVTDKSLTQAQQHSVLTSPITK